MKIRHMSHSYVTLIMNVITMNKIFTYYRNEKISDDINSFKHFLANSIITFTDTDVACTYFDHLA